MMTAPTREQAHEMRIKSMPTDFQGPAKAPTPTPASPDALSSASIRVLCVDDNRDLTEVLRRVIDAQPDLRCVGCLASANDLLAEVRRLCTTPPPTLPDPAMPLVIILDATMPGKDPLEAVGELAAAFPQAKTIIYSGHDDPGFIDRAIDAGAWGCVSKSDEPHAVIRAIHEVAEGRVVFPGRRP